MIASQVVDYNIFFNHNTSYLVKLQSFCRLYTPKTGYLLSVNGKVGGTMLSNYIVYLLFLFSLSFLSFLILIFLKTVSFLRILEHYTISIVDYFKDTLENVGIPEA